LVLAKEDEQLRIVIKGASEIILASCSHYHSKTKGIVEMDEKIKFAVESAIEEMAN